MHFNCSLCCTVQRSRERDLVDEVLGNGADVRAVLDDDVKLDVDPGLGARNDHAAA